MFKLIISKMVCMGFAIVGLAIAGITFAAPTGKAFMLDIQGAIGPATYDYIHRGLERAAEQHATLVILRVDTPGGLDKSMREIVKDIIGSPIPVVSYVAPEGARAASAGTFILYASHIAAMAPATNLGAATPVELISPTTPTPEPPSGQQPTTANKNVKPQSTLAEKATNDAAAYIRSLAQLRERNVTWAEQAVRSAASLPAQEALKLGVIDVIAKNIPDLLQQIDGKVVTVQNHTLQLQTKGLTIEQITPDWRSRFLAVITDPSVAYILLLIGAYGLFFEFANPGFVLPGVAGAIALLLALYAFQLLPVNYVGLALLFLGITFMVLEVFMSTFGVLGIGGIIAFIVGSILLLDSGGDFYSVPWLLIFTMSAATFIFFAAITGMAIKARRRQVVSGREALIGNTVEVREDFQDKGWVRVGGEIWQARSKVPLQRGEHVRIVKIEGLELYVERISKN